LEWRRKIIREVTLPKSIFRDLWLRELIGDTYPFFVDFRGGAASCQTKIGHFNLHQQWFLPLKPDLFASLCNPTFTSEAETAMERGTRWSRKSCSLGVSKTPVDESYWLNAVFAACFNPSNP